MASTASLLFNIAANADDAEASVAAFRTLMGKNLDDLKGEFSQWSEDVFGSLDTVKGAMLGIGAAGAAMLTGALAYAKEATDDYEKLADSISHSMRVTGQSAEDMSVLHFAADETHVSFETLSTGLVRFEGNVSKAAGGSKEMDAAFQKLGISQSDVKAGQTDLMPLLAKVMEGFKGTASAVDRAALAKQLFSRSGPELLNFLMQGSKGLGEFRESAHRAGVVIKGDAIEAFRKLQAVQATQKAIQDQVNLAIGQAALPLETLRDKLMAAAKAALMMNNSGNPVMWAFHVAEAYKEIGFRAEAAAKAASDAAAQTQKIAAAADNAGVVIPKLAEAKTAFYGISTILDGMKDKLASFGNDNEKLAAEMGKYADQVSKARAELESLEKAGKVTAESAARESAALAQIPAMLLRIWQESWEKQIQIDADGWQKKNAEALKGITDLQNKLAAASESGFEGQRAALARETDALAESYRVRGELTDQTWELIQQIYAAGLAKIAAAEKAAHDKENADAAAAAQQEAERLQQSIQRLQEHQDQILEEHTTGQQRLYLQYQKELEKYPELAATITQKFQQDLQTLLNSQGWQGVFGDKFGSMLKGNEQLLKQWQQSTNQSLLMVKVTLQDLKQMSQEAFASFAQSMGQGAVQALEQGKSIETAMRQALSSTLESIAGQAAGQAIYAAGLGFLDLAEQNYEGASAAFTSAAIFGGVAAAAAVTGAAIAPSSTASGGSGGSGGSSGASGSSAAGSTKGATAGSGAPSGQGGYVQLNVSGPIIGLDGAQQLADILNQAVYNNNVLLYATNNPQGKPL